MSTQIKQKSQEASHEDYFDLGKVDLEDAILTEKNELGTIQSSNQSQPHFGYSINQPSASFYKKMKA
jgi:hypothetical protein